MEPGRTEKAMNQRISATGARKGKSNTFRKWIGKMAAPAISVFPVPGEDYFRSRGLHLKDHFSIAAGPREANVLLCGDIGSEELAKYAAVAFLQMPRPRVLVTSGQMHYKNLPQPDLKINYNQELLPELKKNLTFLFAKAYREDAADLLPLFLKEDIEHTNSEHGGHDHSEHDHEGHEHDMNGHGEHDHGEHDHGEHEHGEHEHDGNDHDEHGHGEHEHGGGGMGFMSMVKMTKDMPRATDGLAMDRNQAAFGPFFPGLPGGLALNFTLDGDTVVNIQSNKDLQEKHRERNLDAAENIPALLEKLNPITPATYRIAGELLTDTPGKNLPYHFIHQLEKERIIHHLNWLSTFGVLLGNRWIESHACLHMKRLQQDLSSSRLLEFTRKIHQFRYLKKKLQHAGSIPENLLHHASGPVARSAGIEKDLRSEDENYSKLGFESIIINENNAWGRLRIRLLEIEQSLELVSGIEEMQDKGSTLAKKTQTSSAQLEGPSGIITAKLQETNGKPERIEITDASSVNILLAEETIMEMELSDALISIASLDINPFTLNGFCIQNKEDYHG